MACASDRRSRQAAAALAALTVEDNGPGIPAEALEKIFDSGYTTRAGRTPARQRGWPAAHRGLGLAITRSIVEAAGGRIRAANRAPAERASRSSCRFDQRSFSLSVSFQGHGLADERPAETGELTTDSKLAV